MRYVLAPLADFTNAPFRLLCGRNGAAAVYTEMVSAAALAHGSAPTRLLMETMPGEVPVWCQIFGANPDDLAAAAREATALRRFAGIDLNAGCPMPNIVREGAGAALLRDPGRIYDCLRAIKDATDLPVSLKTRPGPSPDRVLLAEIASAAETAGCAGLTLHARFTSQKHGGAVHLDLLADLVQRTRLPVTGNGSAYDRKAADAMAATGVAAIMIGRAALANPWIFHDLALPEDPPYEELRPRRQIDAFGDHLANILLFHDQLVRNHPDVRIPTRDEFVCHAIRVHLFRYFNGRPNASVLRKTLNTVKTLPDALAAVRAFLA